MKCPFCKHIIRRKDDICNKCGKRYPRMRGIKGTFYCKDCGSKNIKIKYKEKN